MATVHSNSDLNHYSSLVRSIVDAARPYDRLSSFPAIERTFRPKVMAPFATKPPFYCHFMEWRLATLSDSELRTFDDLLVIAESVPGWEKEVRPFISANDFGTYWPFMWQLQVAEYLRDAGNDIEWLVQGPDLVARKGTEKIHGECVVPRKSFDVLTFIEELLRHAHPQLRVEHQLFLIQRLPRGRNVTAFLEGLINPLLNRADLDALAREAELKWPVVLRQPPGATNLTVYMEGSNSSAYDPSVLPQGGGDRAAYLTTALRDAVTNKLQANQLVKWRPNMLFVNFLLIPDAQIAFGAPEAVLPELRGVVDHLAYGAVGIDQHLTEASLRFSSSWRA